MTREDALKIIDELVKSPNIKKHLLAAEAAMVGLYDYFHSIGKVDAGTRQDWALTGLLHDADYEATDKDLDRHTDVVTEKIKGLVSQEVIDAIRGHADKAERKNMMAKSIYAADELTGLIVAAALVLPNKKIADLQVESILKRFKEPAFARGANRQQIKTCENELGLTLAEFSLIVLNSMKKIAEDLGL